MYFINDSHFRCICCVGIALVISNLVSCVDDCITRLRKCIAFKWVSYHKLNEFLDDIHENRFNIYMWIIVLAALDRTIRCFPSIVPMTFLALVAITYLQNSVIICLIRGKMSPLNSDSILHELHQNTGLGGVGMVILYLPYFIMHALLEQFPSFWLFAWLPWLISYIMQYEITHVNTTKLCAC